MAAVSGYLSGSSYLVQIKDETGDTYTTLLGQMDGTLTTVQTPIDVTNKASGGYTQYADGITTNKQITFATTMQFNNDESCERVRSAANEGNLLDLQIVLGDSGETYTGLFSASGMSDTSSNTGELVTYSITFSSSGAYTRTPGTTA